MRAALRVFRHRPAAVGAGALAAIVAGMLAGYHLTLSPLALTSKQQVTGVAESRVFVYRPDTLAGRAGTGSSETLGVRATVLAGTLVTARGKADIAAQIGVAPSELATVGPAVEAPALATPLAVGATGAAAAAIAPYVLAVGVEASRGLISITARAPDVAAATRLTAVAVSRIQAGLGAPAGARSDPYAAAGYGPPAVRTGVLTSGPGRRMQVMAAAFVFALWCAGLIGLDAAKRRAPRRNSLRASG